MDHSLGNPHLSPSFSYSYLHKSHTAHTVLCYHFQMLGILLLLAYKDQIKRNQLNSNFVCNCSHKSRIPRTLCHQFWMVAHHHHQLRMDWTRCIHLILRHQINNFLHTMDNLHIFLKLCLPVALCFSRCSYTLVLALMHISRTLGRIFLCLELHPLHTHIQADVQSNQIALELPVQIWCCNAFQE